MVPLQLSQEAIVLRNYPIGKGFLVRLPDEDKYYDEVEDEGRPPYMFVKCWKSSLFMRIQRVPTIPGVKLHMTVGPGDSIFDVHSC